MKKTQKFGILLTFVLSFITITAATSEKAFAAITSELDLGSTGSQVTQLQQFLATNPLIYPERLVTGYFGPLTKAAVQQMQISYNIYPAGRVGPITIDKINSVLATGYGLDTIAPYISSVNLQTNRTSATVSLTTSENTRAQVYYDTVPLQVDESTRFFELAYISGNQASYTTNYMTSHTVNLQSLQPNTRYYYVARVVDPAGTATITSQYTFTTVQ